MLCAAEHHSVDPYILELNDRHLIHQRQISRCLIIQQAVLLRESLHGAAGRSGIILRKQRHHNRIRSDLFQRLAGHNMQDIAGNRAGTDCFRAVQNQPFYICTVRHMCRNGFECIQRQAVDIPDIRKGVLPHLSQTRERGLGKPAEFQRMRTEPFELTWIKVNIARIVRIRICKGVIADCFDAAHPDIGHRASEQQALRNLCHRRAECHTADLLCIGKRIFSDLFQ